MARSTAAKYALTNAYAPASSPADTNGEATATGLAVGLGDGDALTRPAGEPEAEADADGGTAADGGSPDAHPETNRASGTNAAAHRLHMRRH